MVLAKLTVSGVSVRTVYRQKIPQGIVGATIELDYADPMWAGLKKTMVFWGSAIKDVLDIGTVVTIPVEVVAKAGSRLRVGIYGVDMYGTMVIPTLWADLGPIEGSADPSLDPTAKDELPVWAQLQAQIGDLTQLQTLTKVSIVAAINELVSDAAASDQLIVAMQQDIADLKYEEIKITGITNNVGTVEMGTDVKTVTVSWSLNKDPASQTLNGEAVDASARSATLDAADTPYTLIATDERGATASGKTGITFLNGVYYGVLDDGAEIDSVAVLGLTRKLQGSKALTFTVNAGATQRIAYAIPTRYGTPNFNVGGFDGGFSKAATIDFTNASAYTESYDVWLSDNTGLGSTTVKAT